MVCDDITGSSASINRTHMFPLACVCPQIMRWCQCFPCDLCALDSDDITHRVHDTLLKVKRVISYIPNVQWQQRTQFGKQPNRFLLVFVKLVKLLFFSVVTSLLEFQTTSDLKKQIHPCAPHSPGPLHRSFSNSRRPAVFSISTVWSSQRYLKHKLLQEW